MNPSCKQGTIWLCVFFFSTDISTSVNIDLGREGNNTVSHPVQFWILLALHKLVVCFWFGLALWVTQISSREFDIFINWAENINETVY